MKNPALRFLLALIIISLLASCASIVPPEGGKKDTRPPKLLAVNPPDSQLNIRATKIEMTFNEYVQLNNPNTEIQVSPLLPFPPNVLAVGKKVIIKIPDSALFNNTTYRIYTREAIKDLHEGNAFKPHTYTFSTGAYFDTMQINGIVYDAATGLEDTGAFILLYDAAKSDSIVVKEKPRYVYRVQKGQFTISGLPNRKFKIYALHDANGNLVYDGKGERIAFVNGLISPTDTVGEPIILKSFKEIIIDTLPAVAKGKSTASKDKNKPTERILLGYRVDVDTAAARKRVFDINKPLNIILDRKADTIRKEKMFLSYDSAGITVEVVFTLKKDTLKHEVLHIKANWQEDAVYTLRLQKGFIKDSLGNESSSSKYTFRAKYDDDYAKLEVHFSEKYVSNKYLYMLCTEADTVYFKPIVDTVIKIKRLMPGAYTMRIIVDENKNGKWDTGDLFLKKQPEEVIPYIEGIQLKASWEHLIDFEKPKPLPKNVASPEKRDKPKLK
jgi:hypothetical protein